MPDHSALFEGIDLLDLWHLYGQSERVAVFRSVSPSKISRRVDALLSGIAIPRSGRRGAPDHADLIDSAVLLHLRLAYQHWRLQARRLKVLPTFTAMASLSTCQSLDVLPDVFLSENQIAGHLYDRRIDLVLSSSLDLAGVLIEEAKASACSPFSVVDLFSDEVRLALNPQHPLAGSVEALPEDCAAFPSPAYPPAVAERAAAALRRRGLWRYPCKRQNFDPAEWLVGMRSAVGVCYMSALLQHAVPESRELRLVSFAETLRQTTAVLVLKEIANTPAVVEAIGLIREAVLVALKSCHYEASPC